MKAVKFNPNYLLPITIKGDIKVACSILEHATYNSLFNKKISATIEVTTEVKKLIQVYNGEQARNQLQQLLGLKESENFRKATIKPAIEQGLLEMTILDKPNSSKQKYRLTDKGLFFREGRASNDE